MNLIEEEISKSEAYILKPNCNCPDLVELSVDNVARVEAIICNDSRFVKISDKGNLNSSAFSIIEFKKAWESKDYNKCSNLIDQIVERIDSENGTHLNADGVGRKEITGRIKNLGMDRLIEELKNPEKNNYELITVIRKATHPKEKSNSGKKYRPRKNISFASKFCHYMCFYLFEGKAEQDNYSIYDSVVASALPKYQNFYKCDMALKKKDFNYVDYIRTIDGIIEKSGSNISRNGFDHLLWYYHNK
ncbi:MAG: hypothetical protein E7302_13375 [Butyrivibrio sp.]|jgi:hypothetical protein|nr:hypothetical protein [Butyrivibrio sp.]